MLKHADTCFLQTQGHGVELRGFHDRMMFYDSWTALMLAMTTKRLSLYINQVSISTMEGATLYKQNNVFSDMKQNTYSPERFVNGDNRFLCIQHDIIVSETCKQILLSGIFCHFMNNASQHLAMLATRMLQGFPTVTPRFQSSIHDAITQTSFTHTLDV